MNETETHIFATGPEGEEIDILIEPREMVPEPPVEEATIAWDPSLHPRTRLGQWAQTWGWIRDATEHLLEQPPGPGKLLQGEPRKRGAKRGRKSPLPRPKVKGWKERVEDLRLPAIQQSFLMQKRREALFEKSASWEATSRGVRKGNIEMIEQEGEQLGGTVDGYAVYESDENGLMTFLGWVPFSERMGSQDYYDQIVPPKEQPESQFLNWWWGGMETIGGDPGELFQAQHARIMEAGALLDAEVKRRIAADPVTKERTRVRKALSEALDVLNQREDELDKVSWETVAKALNAYEGTKPPAAYGGNREGTERKARSPEEWKALYLDYMKENSGPYGTRRKSKFKQYSPEWYDATTVWDAWEFRYSDAERQGIDLQGLYDEVFEAKGVAWDLEKELEPLDERAKTLRRDKAYDVLMEIRRFADEEDLDVHEQDPPYGLIPYDYEADRYRNGMRALREATKWLPHDWIKSSNAADRFHKLAVTWKFDGRGRYSHQYASSLKTGQGVSLITGTPSKEVAGLVLGESTMLHELVHRVEDTRDGIKGAEWAFYVSRVSPGRNRPWDTPRPLPEVTEGSYEPDEMTRTDEFPDPYAGKTYGDQMDSSWEILTMGIQDLVSGQHGIIERDEEYRQFVLGSMVLL